MPQAGNQRAKAFAGLIQEVIYVGEEADGIEIPYWEGVNVQELTAGDADPLFLTLPIGKIDSRSGNDRFYDAAFIQELNRQASTEKMVGLLGHLAQNERSWAMPPEAVHWVGSKMVGDTLFGKAYVVPGDSKARIQRYKAQGKKLATSIDAWARGVWDETVKATRMVADSLRLNQIDIAPVDRAGIAALGALPILTTEMDGDEPTERKSSMSVTAEQRIEVIQEMTAKDARLIPDEVRDAIVSAQTPAPEIAHVAGIRAALGLADDADPVARVKEMAAEIDASRKREIAARIQEMAGDDKTGVKSEAVRGLVIEMVNQRQPATVADAEAVYAEIIASPHVKKALEGQLIHEMGGNQGDGGSNQQSGKPKYFDVKAHRDKHK